MKTIDMRSDTVTAPTDEMRKAMCAAEVGDDVYGDDPTVNRLEEYAADRVGKEAALFVPSGTFGNQLALFTHCRRGNEVILGEDCHIVVHEVGASAVIAGVQLRTLKSDKGELDPEDVLAGIRESDIHAPETGLICLENAHSNGRVIPLEKMERIRDIAAGRGIPVHMDGARLFNAAAYLKTDARNITKHCDSVMFCLSKGLCAPVGSMLAGSKQFIERARKGRKLMGGGMRQAGILAAAGLIALQKMTGRLEEDHENALYLAGRLSEIKGITVNPEDVHINMVYFDMSGTGIDDASFSRMLLERNIRVNPGDRGVVRLVTHYWIGRNDVSYVADCIRDIIENRK